jgi:hypothetical protein
MTEKEIKLIRQKTFLYLEPNIAAAAGMRLEQMQQFIGRTFAPSELQLRRLATLMRIEITP